MTHDPLCRWQGSTEFDTVLSCDECDLIAKVREEQRIGIEAVAYFAQRDMLAKCIAAVEAEHPRGVRWWADWLFWSKFRRSLVTYGYDWHKRHAVEALLSLQEKP